MKTELRTLPNGYRVELWENSGDELISEIWDKHCYAASDPIVQGDVVVDIGANQGVFSLYAASRGAKVYAVEPQKDNYEILCANIERNGLTGQIVPVFGAVAVKEGEIALFVPGPAEGVVPSTFTSTSGSWIESLKAHDVKDVQRSTVRAWTLGSLLREVNEHRVSLLKIDTEGAEMDILSGTTPSEMKKVERIGMETHDAYDERDLFWKLRELGFAVVSYAKRGGPFLTGALRARQRVLDGEPECAKPVAILTVPRRVRVGEEVRIDAGKSFSTKNVGGDLLYRLQIDGAEGEFSPEPVKSVRFTKAGHHRILLSVKDREGAVEVDASEKILWVFEEEYGVQEGAIRLGECGARSRLRIGKCESFFIPSASLPKSWLYKSIVVGIQFEEGATSSGRPSVQFRCNGEAKNLDDAYHEIYFVGFPHHTDLAFHLSATGDVGAILQWYARDVEGPNPTLLLEENDEEFYVMGAYGVDHLCPVRRNARFVLRGSSFPTTYKFGAIFLGVAPCGDLEGRRGDGTLTLHGKTSALGPHFAQHRVPFGEIDGDLEFRIAGSDKRMWTITWWAE